MTCVLLFTIFMNAFVFIEISDKEPHKYIFGRLTFVLHLAATCQCLQVYWKAEFNDFTLKYTKCCLLLSEKGLETQLKPLQQVPNTANGTRLQFHRFICKMKEEMRKNGIVKTHQKSNTQNIQLKS